MLDESQNIIISKQHISSRSHNAHFPMAEISSPTDIFYFSADFLVWWLWSSVLWHHLLFLYQCFIGMQHLHHLSWSDSAEDAVRLYRQVTKGVVNQISGKGRGDRTWSGPIAMYPVSLPPLSDLSTSIRRHWNPIWMAKSGRLFGNGQICGSYLPFHWVHVSDLRVV
jgi:hypothetical protein